MLGIGLVGASTLMFEVALTRIFSVTMWYHFAFVAISLALFGLAASGVAVDVFRRLFPPERAVEQMGLAAGLMGATMTASFAIDLRIPFLAFDAPSADGTTPYLPYVAFGAKFLVLSLPFFWSGLCIALAFTHEVAPVHRAYGADLVGGGIGCALIIPVLRAYSGPSTIIFASAHAFLASALLFSAVRRPRRAAGALTAVVAFLGLAMTNDRLGLLRIDRVKSYRLDRAQEQERPKIYEKWHPTSRLAVHPIAVSLSPRSWFYSAESPVKIPACLEITNDGGARTFLYPKLPDERLREFFSWDVSDLVYALVRDPEVLVIGVGGGKDILSAKALGASHITGVEINPLMIDLTQVVFAGFTGAPYRDPRISIVLAEGRNYIASRKAAYDVIKLSGTDTWAASAVGAYALAENYLYTREAMQDYLSHLKPAGFLTISRFYPREAPRLMALAAESVRLRGGSPQRRLLMARNDVMFTLLVKNGDVSETERAVFTRTSARAGLVSVPFDRPPAVLPSGSLDSPAEMDSLLVHVVHAPTVEDAQAGVPTRLVPPTDDSPFFFNDVWFRDASRGRYFSLGGITFHHGRALALLLGLLKVTVALTLLFVLLPVITLRADARRPSWRLRLVASGYFLTLGLGYLLIEIPLLQQFILYLGHPVYATTVVLFVLLIASGTGGMLLASRLRAHAALLFVLLLVALLLCVLVLPSLLRHTIGLPGPWRVLLSSLFLIPPGLLMGTPFPGGLRVVRGLSPALVPWAWAVNGAASVAAPVLAMILAVGWGFRTSFLAGTAAYALASVLFSILCRAESPAPTAR